MANELEAFHIELMQDVAARAAASGEMTRTVFVEAVASRLVEAEELQEWLPCYYDGRGYRRRAIGVDGYSAEELPLDGTLHVLIADLHTDEAPQPLTNTEVREAQARVCNFVEDAHSARLHDALEPSTPAGDLARLIHESAGAIRTLRVHVLSNAVLGTRFKEKQRSAINKIKVELQVWDLGRLQELAGSGGREPLDIELTELAPQGLPALPASIGDIGYAAYLCVVPGGLLAEIYERHGSRLLEGNVRAFLSARGNVNKGLRRTITQQPEMFFAFNNGITATAAAADVIEEDGAFRIRKVTDLQIVNGGQTTASLFNARARDKAELDKIFVQMKLAVLPPDVAQVLTPEISRYANTQNKVSDADLFANHPFHRRVEDISKRVWAPPREGTQQATHWFYERARAQYQTDVSKLNGAEKRAFQLKNPDAQVIEKTELALYENTWRKQPNVVSLGAQKNFIEFAERVRAEFEERPDEFNDRWFQHVVAKTILFRSTEDLVSRAPWYPGGYRRNIVTYAIARLVRLIEQSYPKHVLDLDRLWKAQAISPTLGDQILMTARVASQQLINPPEPWKNVTEWAKKERCWELVAAAPVEPLPDLFADLKPKQEERAERSDARDQAQEDDAIDAVTQAVKLGADGMWRKAFSWPGTRRLLSPVEYGILTTAASARKTWVPSDLQARRLISALKKLQEDGFV